MIAIDFDTNERVRVASEDEVASFKAAMLADPWALVTIDGLRCYLVQE